MKKIATGKSRRGVIDPIVYPIRTSKSQKKFW
jgi:hypothetical protein